MDASFDHIDHFRKVVDECLVYDDTFPEHVARVRQVLTCARENGVTLSASKFIFAKPEVNYCGFILNRQGRTVDDQKTAAIQQFPVPTNRTDLRSFMGLINQCGEFIPNLAAATAPLRGLLKTSDDFLWTEDHTRAFNAAKDTLLASTTLSFFQVGQPLRLILKVSCIVIPASLRSSVVEDLHAAHQGIVRMKARAADCVLARHYQAVGIVCSPVPRMPHSPTVTAPRTIAQ